MMMRQAGLLDIKIYHDLAGIARAARKIMIDFVANRLASLSTDCRRFLDF